MALEPNGDYFVSTPLEYPAWGGFSSSPLVYKPPEQHPVMQLQGGPPAGLTTAVDWHPSLNIIASGSQDAVVRFHHLNDLS